MSAAWVPVAKDDVVKPIRDDALSVHQVSDGLQHGLKHRDKSGSNGRKVFKKSKI